jgi:DNA-binding PadR family transcriptional regulator
MWGFKLGVPKSAGQYAALEQQIVDSRRALVPLELLYLVRMGYNTGYTIKKAYEKYFGISVSFGTIYPLLHSLHKGGFLTRKTLTGRTQKFYSLSREGQKALELNANFMKTFSRALSERNIRRKVAARPSPALLG